MKLLKGDCMELLPQIPDKSVDLVLCDLPYGTTQCKWDAVTPFDPLWEQYDRVLKENGACVLFSAQPFTSALIMSNAKKLQIRMDMGKNIADRPAQRQKNAHEGA